MRILVNGGSISRGPGSWPYAVQRELTADLVNLAQAGSGNSYVHETTIAEIAQRDYDLVLVQWTAFTRFDYKVENPSLFSKSIYTSNYQSSQNDWPEKQIHPVNDQDYVEKDWIFGCGVVNKVETDLTTKQAFEDFYNYAGNSEYMYHALMKIISLQSFLQVKKVPYLFCFGRPLKVLNRYKHLWDQIDQSRMFTDQYLLEISEKNNWWGPDGAHPNELAYEEYTKHLVPAIHKVMNEL